MCKNKILEKLLAVILIFTLTFANFAFVTESLAMSITETLFKVKSDTGHKNVEFEAYFGTEEEKETSVISSVNEQDLSINLNLSVQDVGYLKDGKIEILETEEGKGLNFKIKENAEFPEDVQSFEENTIFLKQIDFSSKNLNILLPIEYESEEYVKEEKLSQEAKIYFSGIYMDEEGKEVEVSREIILRVSWKDEREVKVESNVTKYIDFGEGIILQTSVKMDNFTDENTLPVKKSKLEVNVPVLEEIAPTNISVIANSTEGTNGKKAGNVEFNKDNWFYDEETKLLTITVDNNKQLVKIDENADDYLKEADAEIIEEKRYYSKSGIDEYLITYTFEGVNMPENAKVTSNILAELTLLTGVENDNFINVMTSENVIEYSLEEKIGDIVSLNIQNETKEISKAYLYSNYNHSNQYEIEHHAKTIINVAYREIIEQIYVDDVENAYIDKQGNRIFAEDMYYKQISISKENFEQILGTEGEIKFLDYNGNVIVTINKDYEVNEEGNFVVPFENKISKIKIEATAPISEGNLIIHKTKVLDNLSIDKETFKNITSNEIVEKISAKYTYVENIVEVEKSARLVSLLDTTTKANLILDRDSLSTLAMNENVELRVEFNNAKDTSDLYGHSVFEIELPSEVKSVEVTNAQIVYGEGLQITSVEIIDRIIRVIVDGIQDGINSGVLTNGKNIELNAHIKVDIYAPEKTEKIKFRYTNDAATNYISNGYEEIDIQYSAPTGLVTVNSISNYNANGNTLTSVRQGYKEDLIEIYSEVKTPTMEMIIMNNYNNPVSGVSILGRIPTEGVKDIVSGQDLETTVNTKMITSIISDERNNTNFSIYYSENVEATKDLQDIENGWTMNPETLEIIKSYLIVPVDTNYEMQKTEIWRFTYQYEIPGNLSHNENIFGTFVTYYTNHSEVATTEETSTPDLVGLTTGKGPELEINIQTARETIKEFEEIETTIKVKNIGEEMAKEVFVNLPIPQYTKFKTVKCDKENVAAGESEGTLKDTVGDIAVDEIVEIKI